MSAFLHPLALDEKVVWVLVGVAVLIVLVGLGFLFVYGRLYLQAMTSGVPVSPSNLIGMTLRRVSAQVIVTNLITAHKAKLNIGRDELEAH